MADMVVRSPSGAIALIVEVKARPQATDKWAATLRRNFSAHGMISDSAYFLLALPDFFNLWKPGTSIEVVHADYKVSANDALKDYLQDISLKDLSTSSLELLLGVWVSNLLESKITLESEPELSWLIDSGLYEYIKGGSIHAQAPL